MRHGLKCGVDRVTGHILAKCEPQRVLIALKYFTFEQVAQCDQRRFIIRNFDTNITMTRHRRLYTDARCCQRQSKIICQRSDLADAHFRASASCLDEERLRSELRDRGSAIDLHHLHWCSK